MAIKSVPTTSFCPLSTKLQEISSKASDSMTPHVVIQKIRILLNILLLNAFATCLISLALANLNFRFKPALFPFKTSRIPVFRSANGLNGIIQR